jgi:hypothetical protein
VVVSRGLTSSSSRQIRAAREFAAELRRYMREEFIRVGPSSAAVDLLPGLLLAAVRGEEQLNWKACAYNKRFQPTPQRCALGFPRPLRGLGAAEPRRYIS